jgi:hypothetical protein
MTEEVSIGDTDIRMLAGFLSAEIEELHDLHPEVVYEAINKYFERAFP